MEQIQDAEAPNSRGNSQGVQAWGERAEKGLGGMQKLDQLAAPRSILNRNGMEREREPKAARRWPSKRVQADITCSMVWVVGGKDHEGSAARDSHVVFQGQRVVSFAWGRKFIK